MLTAGLAKHSGVGTKRRGLKVDLKLDLHPCLHQKSLAGLLMLNSTALQARAPATSVHAKCIPTSVFEAIHPLLSTCHGNALQDAWMLLEPMIPPA